MLFHDNSFAAALKTAVLALAALALAVFILIPGLAGLAAGTFSGISVLSAGPFIPGSIPAGGDGDYIRWVDFNVPQNALERAFRWDVDTVQSEIHIDWVDLLACLGARYGGDFSNYRQAEMDELADRLKNGETMEDIAAGLKYYS